MNIQVKDKGIGTELIYDGILFTENLRQAGKDETWLMGQLKSQGINNISEVFLATINPEGSLYIDKYDDHIQKAVDIGDYRGPF
jgi:uncharacterized membrane protein YcaP (DUF421 family)